VLLAGFSIAYSGLVKRRNRTQEAWSEIDVELKRRHDLIPNLVSKLRTPSPARSESPRLRTSLWNDAPAAGATGFPQRKRRIAAAARRFRPDVQGPQGRQDYERQANPVSFNP
jgi:hypothetical protein